MRWGGRDCDVSSWDDPGVVLDLEDEKKEGSTKTKIKRKKKTINTLNNKDNKDDDAMCVKNAQKITRDTYRLFSATGPWICYL